MASRVKNIKKSSKNPNIATPSHVFKETQRNLSNSKGEMRKDTQNNLNSYDGIQSKVRLCVVRIKRLKSIPRLTNTNRIGGYESADTMQGKCIDDGAPQADGYNSATRNILKSIGNIKSSNPVKHGILKPQAKAGAAFAFKKCVVRVKRLAYQKEFYVRNADKDALLTSQMINPSMDHEKRVAFRKLSLTMHSISMDNDVSLANTIRLPERTPTKNSKSRISKQISVFNSHTGNKLSSANNLQPKRSKRQKELVEPSKTEQETNELQSLCDKENQAPSVIIESRQHKGAICPLSVKVQNIKPLHNIQVCRSKELQLKRNLKRHADVISNTYPKRHTEKALQNRNDTKTRSKDQQEIELKDNIRHEVSEQTKGLTPSYNKRYPVVYIKNLKQYKNNTISKANNFLPQSSSAFHSQDPKSDVSSPKAQISKQIKHSNASAPLLTATTHNKNTIFSDDAINTLKLPETHYDNDRQSNPVCFSNEFAITSPHAAPIDSTNKGVGTASILEFHPQRNSTMHFECEQPVCTTISNEKRFKKVAGSQENHDKEVSYSMSHSTKDGNKTNKFFHRQHANTGFSMCKITEQMASKKTNNSRLLSKKSSQVRREQVYDFLSQSQVCDSDGNVSGGKKNKPADPAADIIQKLIAEGKVSVAKCVKGRSVLKRIHVKKPKKDRQNRDVAKKKTNKGHDIQKSTNKPSRIIKTIVEQKDDQIAENDFIDNDDECVFAGQDLNANKNNNSNTEQEGTFSNLAKSVLLNQAGRCDPQGLNAKRLLDIAKKLLSTPKNKYIPPTTIQADFSPIPSIVTQPRLARNASPWRVDEDAHLPRVFTFSRSSGNLPSFSSDFFPSTPRKGNSNRTNKSNKIEVVTGRLNRFSTPLDHNGVNSSMPSFSSNDSNDENKCPEKKSQTNDESADIFNLKHFPNPRRALSYRSPLKAINILEVVTLPPLDISKVVDNNKNPHDSLSKRLKSANKSKEDLFGFEEFLSQNDVSTQEEKTQTTDESTSTSPIEMINEKRHLLRKLKPTATAVHKSLQKEVYRGGEQLTNKNEQLFNDRQIISRKQRTVKEMLCSTMLNETTTTNSNAQEKLRNIARYPIEQQNNTTGMLFKDIEPETTFNEEDPHRTYIRPHRRKRRLNENRAIFTLESDDSDSDGNDLTQKKTPNKNQNHETDTSFEKQPIKRRKKRQRKEKPELKHFVESFNEMCKEVENYKLVVEKRV